MKESLKQMKRSKVLLMMFFFPFLYFIVFRYIPMFGILIAFENFNIFDGFFKSEWVGLKYFNQFLTDPYFWKLVRNTVVLNIYMIIFDFPAPILLALLLNEMRHLRYKKLVQSISYLPHFLSTVVVCGMVVNLLAYEGMFNHLLQLFGLAPVNFLMEASWFRTIYITSGVWQGIGWGSIIFLAALTNVDLQLYEAARIDGAGRWKQMLHVTLPGILPVIIIMFLLNLGDFMSVGYEKILLLYTGPTYETADVISTFVYRRGLLGSDFSFATAVGVFQSVIALLLLIGANQLSRRVGETSLW